MKPLRFLACVSSFALVASVALAVQSEYDDMAALRPSGEADEFWNTTRHPAVAIDVCDSDPSGMDSRVPQAASADVELDSFDSRWRTAEASLGDNLFTTAPGTLILFR